MKKQRRRTQHVTFPAPVEGWVANSLLVSPPAASAAVLDNIFPTAQGGRLRDGKEKHATVTGEVRRLLEYRSGSQENLFACTEGAIYDVTSPADADVSPAAAVSGLTGGDWVGTQFANASGEYLYCVNGEDPARHFNGVSWVSPSITGVSSSVLSQIWTYKERLFFIEKGTLSFWYLGINSISGAATEYPLGGVFHLGGSLMFGATWSVDSGSGLNDLCVFVTTEGEVAIFSGNNPSDASSWGLQGVYRIGKPLDKAGFYRSGGDLMVLTEDGIANLNDAIYKDRAQMQSASASYAIEDAWQNVTAFRAAGSRFATAVWPEKTMLVIGVPQKVDGLSVAFVANTRTGKWCRYLGWDVGCMGLMAGQLYFGEPGTSESVIYMAERTASDDGVGYSGRWVPSFHEGLGEFKSAIHARVRARAKANYNFALAAFSDYVIGSYPSVGPDASENEDTWGSGRWGSMVWGNYGSNVFQTEWRTVRAGGSSLTPVCVIPSNRSTANSLELIAVDLVYEPGNLF